MHFRICIATALFGLLLVQPSNAVFRIEDDMGGRLGDYIQKFSAIRRSGERVIIDGRCYSACTLVTGMVPRRNICVTARATLGFHTAHSSYGWGSSGADYAATRTLYNLYPGYIKAWLNQHGGLRASPIILGGRDLLQMYSACPHNAYSRF
jgi:hypothetical protein